MKPHALTVKPPGFHFPSTKNCRRHVTECSADARPVKRRGVLVAPLVALGAYALRSAVAKADVETPPPPPPPAAEAATCTTAAAAAKEEVISSRIYDATVIGEPLAVGKDKRKVWEKMMNARIVYLGEAEQVPTGDDKEVEVEIVKNLRKRCAQLERNLSLALEAFPCDLQEQLDRYMDKRINEEELKSLVTQWASPKWQEYKTLLSYCRDNGIRLIACGLPLQILRTIQAEGVRGLSKSDRKKYAPPAGSGFISGFSSISRRSSPDLNFTSSSAPYEPSSYLSIQARVVEDYSMSQIILQAVADGGTNGMLVVVTGAGHVAYGSRGTGLPARISRKCRRKIKWWYCLTWNGST